MKKLISLALVLTMILALAACSTAGNDVKPTEAPKTTEAPAEPTEAPAEPTEAPAEQHEFKTGGVDFCEELVLGETYYYDLDGDGLCDTIYYNDESQEAYLDYETGAPVMNSWPNLKITRGRFPNAPFIFNIPEEGPRVWVVDSNPGDGRLEIIVTDAGPSDDPESVILTPMGISSGFFVVDGPGVVIDEEHPFSSENGFTVKTWTQVLGTNSVYGKMRYDNSKMEFELTSKAYYVSDWYSQYAYTLRHALNGTLTNEEFEPGEAITLEPGTKVSLYATDDESFAVLRLEDGRLVRAETELREWTEIPEGTWSNGGNYPWMIAGEWQDILFEDIMYSG